MTWSVLNRSGLVWPFNLAGPLHRLMAPAQQVSEDVLLAEGVNIFKTRAAQAKHRVKAATANGDRWKAAKYELLARPMEWKAVAYSWSQKIMPFFGTGLFPLNNTGNNWILQIQHQFYSYPEACGWLGRKAGQTLLNLSDYFDRCGISAFCTNMCLSPMLMGLATACQVSAFIGAGLRGAMLCIACIVGFIIGIIAALRTLYLVGPAVLPFSIATSGNLETWRAAVEEQYLTQYKRSGTIDVPGGLRVCQNFGTVQQPAVLLFTNLVIKPFCLLRAKLLTKKSPQRQPQSWLRGLTTTSIGYCRFHMRLLSIGQKHLKAADPMRLCLWKNLNLSQPYSQSLCQEVLGLCFGMVRRGMLYS